MPAEKRTIEDPYRSLPSPREMATTAQPSNLTSRSRAHISMWRSRGYADREQNVNFRPPSCSDDLT
jgi:hypothetical protein